MDWTDFVHRNSSSLIALCGVALGGLLTAVTVLLTQSMQHRWNLEAQRREWRRARREQQLDSVLAWLNQWLRAATRMRHVEASFREAKIHKRRPTDINLQELAENLVEQSNHLREQTAIAEPIVQSINDAMLIDFYQEFRSLISRYQDVLQADDIDEAIESNETVISEAKVLVSQFQQRADDLIEDVFDAS